MVLITGLPCELIACILQQCDNVVDLAALTSSCRCFRSVLRTWPKIRLEIVNRQIPAEFLGLAVGTMIASCVPKPLITSGEILTQKILHTMTKDPKIYARALHRLPFPSLIRLSCTHNIIEEFVMEMAHDAWSLLRDKDGQVSGALRLSRREKHRMMQAMYEVEFLSMLFRDTSDTPGRLPSRSEGFLMQHGYGYLAKKRVWEMEQMACALDFLEKKFFQASLNILAHDVEFGKLGIDYVAHGWDNKTAMHWLSQGVHFIKRLTNESSYKTKRQMLMSAYQSCFMTEITSLIVAISADLGFPLREPMHGLVEPLSLATLSVYHDQYPMEGEDLEDKGPRLALTATHDDLLLAWNRNAGLRERGYVFWDANRLMDQSGPRRLVDFFFFRPSSTYQAATDEELAEVQNMMEPTISRRKEIWDQGGRGYWRHGDETQISWTHTESQL